MFKTATLGAAALTVGLAGAALAGVHDDIVLRGPDYEPISASASVENAFSVKGTCGWCHNGSDRQGVVDTAGTPDLSGPEQAHQFSYDEIEKHGYHAQLSANEIIGWNPWNPDSASAYKSGPAPKGKNWVQSTGHVGRW